MRTFAFWDRYGIEFRSENRKRKQTISLSIFFWFDVGVSSLKFISVPFTHRFYAPTKPSLEDILIEKVFLIDIQHDFHDLQ